ncbi:MAG: polysaccharide deacetylase family protein, partial [Candidatus Zixiibacteriota bacterium]
MRQSFLNMLKAFDRALSRLYLRLAGDRPALMVFMVHRLFPDEKAVEAGDVDPLERLTLSQFRLFVQFFLEQGYRFVSEEDLAAGLSEEGRYVMVTFDDGYANNAEALPVMQEFGVPILLFVSSQHIREGKCFWWDVLYRERYRQGVGPDRIVEEALQLKALTTEAIEQKLREEFGNKAFNPEGELDRPFTEPELTSFAGEPLVTIGNHTHNHAILTSYDNEGVREQISKAQEAIEEMTGIRPRTISYPNGNYNAAICNCAREAGLRFGVTVDSRKNYLPVVAGTDKAMRLGRFILSGQGKFLEQLNLLRSDIL